MPDHTDDAISRLFARSHDTDIMISIEASEEEPVRIVGKSALKDDFGGRPYLRMNQAPKRQR